ncbi:carboxypeptidase-like regulatory domain-containing protein [Haloferax volcanii]|nr:carboxypeptidase-like regulatory domain-containing protein [Haloferax alexandrinus]
MQFSKHIKSFAALMMVMMLGVGGFVGTAAAASDVSGTVTDANGDPVEGATVEAVDSNGSVVASATTSSDGSYSLTGLSDSTSYTLEVSAENYQTHSESYSTGTGTSETLDITLSTWTATYDRPADGTPTNAYAEFDTSTNVTITVEAHNSSSGSWETVVDAKQYSVDGSSDSVDAVEVALDDYDGEDYDQYRLTVEGAAPASAGVADDTSGGGAVIPGTDSLGIEAVVIGGFGVLVILSMIGAARSQ